MNSVLLDRLLSEDEIKRGREILPNLFKEYRQHYNLTQKSLTKRLNQNGAISLGIRFNRDRISNLERNRYLATEKELKIVLSLLKRDSFREIIAPQQGNLFNPSLEENIFGKPRKKFLTESDLVKNENTFIADYCHFMRKELDWTQKDLANKLGFTDTSSISRMERRRSPISNEFANRLLRIFGSSRDNAKTTVEEKYQKTKEYAEFQKDILTVHCRDSSSSKRKPPIKRKKTINQETSLSRKESPFKNSFEKRKIFLISEKNSKNSFFSDAKKELRLTRIDLSKEISVFLTEDLTIVPLV